MCAFCDANARLIEPNPRRAQRREPIRDLMLRPLRYLIPEARSSASQTPSSNCRTALSKVRSESPCQSSECRRPEQIPQRLLSTSIELKCRCSATSADCGMRLSRHRQPHPASTPNLRRHRIDKTPTFRPHMKQHVFSTGLFPLRNRNSPILRSSQLQCLLRRITNFPGMRVPQVEMLG